MERAQTEVMQSPDFRNAPDNFKDRAKETISEVVDQANPAIQGELRANLAQQAASATADLRRRSARMSQDAAVAAYNNKAENEVSNFAQADDPEERKAAMNRASDIAKRIVRSGAETPEEVKQRLDATRQTAHVRRAEFLRRNDRFGEAREWVRDSDQLNEEQKRVLLDQIENDEEQVAEETRALAGQAMEFVQSTGGRTPDSVDGVPYAEIKRRTAGTEVGQELREVERMGTELRGHVSQPLRDQRARINEMGEATTPDELRKKKAFQKATKTAEEALADGRALEYMSNQGLLGEDLPPLFSRNGEVNPSALRARKRAANRAEDYFGTSNIMPLRKSEREALRQAVNQSESSVVQQTFRTMSRTLGKKRTRLIATNLASDNPTAGVALYAAPDAPKTSRTILDARGAYDSNDVTLPEDEMAVAQEVYGEAFAGSPRTMSAYIEAAKNVYAMRVKQSGEFGEGQEDDWKAALRLVANGKVNSTGSVVGGPTTINKRITLPPSAGTSKETFRRAVSEGINEQNIVDFGNGTPAYMNAQGELVELSPQQLREAKLTFVGNGEYTFELNGGAVMSMRGGANAGPFKMDLEEVVANMEPQ
jgi:hypothetical protein